MTTKKRRKILALCLSLAMLFSVTPLQVTSTQPVKAAGYGISNPRTDKNGVSTWDCIYFGNYYQSNSTTKEPIKWRVLSVNGDDAFLLADKNLDCQPYNTEWKDVTWETCTLRKWLNNDFYNTAFSASEKSAIKTTSVVNEDNPEYGTEGGNNTNDKVYLLSIQEAMNPSYGFSSDYDGEVKNTEYAKEQGAWTSESDKYAGNGWWWLRSPGRISDSAAHVGPSGYVIRAGDFVSSNDFSAVRPALHLNLSSTKWSKAGTVSSAGGSSGGSTGMEENVTHKYDFTTNYISEDKDKKTHTGQIRVKFDENELKKSSKNYNHSVATFCSILSTIAYDVGDGFQELMNRMGYHYRDSYIDEKGDSICYSLADKRIELDGEETDIVLAVMRGTYNMEWIDNFNPGTGETHKGFQKGADVAYQALKRYIEKNHIGEDGRKVKIIVTGHSRGAAVANLLGKEILDKGGSFLRNSNDLFDYSFATPNSTSLSERTNSKYDGIFSIVNPEDFVTKVMLSKNWNYGRYGKTKVLPSKSTDGESWYKSYLSDMRTNFGNFRPYDYYEPYKNGMRDVSAYVNYVAQAVPTVNYYYNKPLGYNPLDLTKIRNTLKNLYTYFLGYNQCKNAIYEKVSYAYVAKAIVGDYGFLGQSTVSYFIVNQVLDPKFEYAHLSETYLAAMMALDENTLCKERKILHGIVNCPVDIEIRNEMGKVVGSIVNNEIVSDRESDNVSFSVTGDSKQFWISGNENYNVSLMGNDNGTMDYILSEEDADSGETKRTLYKTVPIQSDSVYSSEISGDGNISDMELQDSEGKVVNISNELDKDELGALSVMVEIEGIGSANSYNNLSYGDAVVLSAVADQNNSFLGWYDSEDNIVSKEKEYPIIVTENQKYIAKFTNIVVAPESINVKEKLTMSPGEIRCMEASVLPDNTTCSEVSYESNDENVVSVTEDGIIEAQGVGKATITVKSLMDESIQNKCEVVVKSTDSHLTTSPQPTKNNLLPSRKTKNKLSKTKRPGKVTGLRLKKKKKKSVTLSWKKVSGAKGYQLQYALNKKFTKKKKSKFTKKRKFTVKKLKKKKTYYFRVRAYKLNGKKKVYGKWSGVKKVKIKK